MELLGKFQSEDSTIKNIFKNDQNKIVEISLINNKPYDVLCVPSFHYCNLGCIMCHLTTSSINKSQSKVSIEELLEGITYTVSNHKKDNLLISFMGVGEPLLNIELLLNLYKNEEVLKSLGYKNICYSISTMMPNKSLIELTNIVNELNIPLKIHYSLHTPDDDKRSVIIPSSKVSIDSAYEMLQNYQNTLSKNKKVMDSFHIFHNNDNLFETHYTLIKDVNDSAFELSKLVNYLMRYNSSIKFIKFNETNDLSESDKLDLWVNAIRTHTNSKVKVYLSPGKDIGSSCGAFTKHYYLSEIETEEEYLNHLKWVDKHKVKELSFK